MKIGIEVKDKLKSNNHTHNTLDIIHRIYILKSVVEALDFLHDHFIVHFDLKLDNLLYNGTKISLIDFGLMTKLDNIYHTNNYNMYINNLAYYYPNELKVYSAIMSDRFNDKLVYNSDNLIHYINNTLSKYSSIDFTRIKKILDNIKRNLHLLKNAHFLKSKLLTPK